MSAVIRTTGLTKRFGRVAAVAGLDLQVDRGEIFGFLGPNGAGKTTTIRLLMDILRPTSGSVEVLGASPADPATRARVGFLPADLHIEPRYTAGEVLAFLGALRGGFDAAEIRLLLERFDLDPDRPFGELSTGNRRKVGVVQALVGRPALLILDEPTSGLDPLLQHELLSSLQERAAEGTTVFLSSHVLPEVERIASRAGVVRDGQLVWTGRIDDLRARARQRLDLHLDGHADAELFRDIPGVTRVDATGNVLSVTIEGPVDAVLKRAAQLSVQRVVSHETDLEDAFLEWYR